MNPDRKHQPEARRKKPSVSLLSPHGLWEGECVLLQDEVLRNEDEQVQTIVF